MKKIFTTDPHGEHMVRQLDTGSKLAIGNRLFEIQARDGQRLFFTGEELDSLTKQWGEWRKANL